jgi:glycosyltransferase involved in cell wall biosynthesis
MDISLPDVTVVIPYFNEVINLPLTLKLISSQTLMPKEVIFINSTSTDQSSQLVDDWIKKNQCLFETKFKNICEQTRNPSSSKNLGIKHTQTEWIAFMDCGLIFEKDWLELQWKFIKSKDVDIVFGSAFFSGENIFDKCAIAQTYGYKSFNPGMIPSSLLRKKIFIETGYFLPRRSAYDFAWRMKVSKLKIKNGINLNVIIKYNGINFAPSLWKIFTKNIIYYAPSIKIPNYTTSYYFLIIFLIFSTLLIFQPQLLFLLIPLYILLRGILVPYRKSKNILLFKENPLALFILPLVGFSLDAGRLVGIFLGIYRYHLKGNPACDY